MSDKIDKAVSKLIEEKEDQPVTSEDMKATIEEVLDHSDTVRRVGCSSIMKKYSDRPDIIESIYSDLNMARHHLEQVVSTLEVQ